MLRKIFLASVLAGGVLVAGNFEKATKSYVNSYSKEEAARLFEKSCDEGNAAGCYMAAYTAEQNGYYTVDDEGIGKLIDLYEKACKLGDMDGCAAAAGAYEGSAMGSVRIDYDKAIKYYEKACEGEVGEACAKTAARYYGEYGEKNAQKALKYYSLACDYKDSQGCYMVARIYEKGETGAKDLKKAAELYGLSCDYGYDFGCMKFRELVK